MDHSKLARTNLYSTFSQQLRVPSKHSSQLMQHIALTLENSALCVSLILTIYIYYFLINIKCLAHLMEKKCAKFDAITVALLRYLML
jgi:hypothetical protein